MKYIIYKDYETMSRAAADFVIEKVNNKPDLVVCFPTGSTPIRMYELLVEANKAGKVDFSKANVLAVDGYTDMAADHERNFSRFLHDNLYNHCNFDPSKIKLMKTDASDLEAECKRYDQVICDLGGIDLLIDGLGENGHAAYNEPADFMQVGTHIDDLSESTIKANSRHFDDINEVPTQGMTLGIDSFVQAKSVLILVNGPKKTAAVKTLVSDNTVTPRFPMSFIKLANDATVMVDEEAAGDTKAF